MENNLDKYFRDNLHNRRFEMKEEYWLGAEALLDAQADRRRRRLLFWWFGGGLGILLLAGLAWWILAKDEVANPTAINDPIASENYRPNQENPSTQTVGLGENPGCQQAETTVQETATPNEVTKTNTTQTGLSDQQSTKNTPTFKTTQKQSVANSRTRSPLSSTSSKAQMADTKQQEGNQTKIEHSSDDQATVLAETSARNPKDEALFSVGERPSEAAILMPLDRLNCFVTGDFNQNPLATKVAEANSIVPAKPGRLHAGLTFSQLFQPRPGDGENWRLGNQLGLALRFDLNHGFYLASGLQYQRRGGHFEATKLAEQRNYRFGLELDTVALRPQKLHYLTVPALVGWEKNHHSIELGLQFDFLTGVTGETGSYRKVGEPPLKAFVADKKGWITKDGYHRYIANLQFGYSYRIGRLWSVGLAANYSLNGILNPSFEPPVGGFLLRESDKFYLNLKANYFFN